eukprot:11928213-Alexandrium_andersonii.AAC.1
MALQGLAALGHREQKSIPVHSAWQACSLTSKRFGAKADDRGSLCRAGFTLLAQEKVQKERCSHKSFTPGSTLN